MCSVWISLFYSIAYLKGSFDLEHFFVKMDRDQQYLYMIDFESGYVGSGSKFYNMFEINTVLNSAVLLGTFYLNSLVYIARYSGPISALSCLCY